MSGERDEINGKAVGQSAFAPPPRRMGQRACVALHAFPAGIAYLDARQRYRFVNEKYALLFGRVTAEFVGKPFDAVAGFRAGEKARDQLSAVSAGGATTVLNEILTPSGTRCPVLVQMIPDVDDRGTLRGVLILVNDVSESRPGEVAPREDETAVESANLLTSLVLWAAIHDLRQPLYAMELLVDSLGSMVDGDEEKSIVADLKEVLAGMGGPLGGLLDVSRQIGGAMSPEQTDFSVGGLFEKVGLQFSQQARDKGLDLCVVPSTAIVHTSPVLLERIVTDRVANVLRHAGPGRILVGCRRRRSALRIEVWSSETEAPTDVFDAAFRGALRGPAVAPGTEGNAARDRRSDVEGLALLLGHRIDTATVAGKGTVFAIDVPLGYEPSSERLPYPVAAPTNDAGASLTALVIDDNENVLKAMRRALERWGFHVVVAESVEVALARLSALERDPDVVIADYNLPGGLTGIDAIRLVSATRNAKIAGLVISGDDSPDIVREVRSHDCNVLHKPVSSRDFRAVLSNICGPLPQ